MEVLWNIKTLERPATNTWITSENTIDLKKFIIVLEKAINDLESQNALHTEATILSRLIYRMKSKFRNDKGLKNMEKINRALLNYLELQLCKEYKELRNGVELEGNIAHLPTKQMVEHILVRTQGFAKLMCRIENVSKCAAEFFKARLTMGHAWGISIVAYAIISRVWFLSRYLIKRCCSWYNGVRQYLQKFKQIGPPWLPEDYHLPENLKTWLNLPWIDQAAQSIPLRKGGKDTIFGLIKAQTDDPDEPNLGDKDDSFFLKTIETSIDDNFLNESKTDEKISKSSNKSVIQKSGALFATDDIGTSINRNAFEGKLRKKIDENISAAASAKKRKKVLTQSEKKKIKISNSSNELESAVCDETNKIKRISEVGINKDKLKSTKSKKKSPIKITDKTASDIKTRDDLLMFLNKDSYPGLDKLQWKMFKKSIEKFVVKLDKLNPSDEKREKLLVKKANRLIQNWMH